ncbi:TPA: GIY-YIG nuclease family protein [Pseudomonas aeruginosa]
MKDDPKQILAALEHICRSAYEADPEQVKNLFHTVSSADWSIEYPFLSDAIKINLTWHKQALSDKERAQEPGVYVIEYQSGTVKIGKTTNFQQRYRALATTSSVRPTRFHFEKTANHSQIELSAHRAFADKRCNGEFFSVGFEDAVDAVKTLVAEGVRK